MRTVALIARVLLGVIFVVFGLNGFLHFLPMGPLPTGPAMQYFTALAQTHYMDVVFAVQLLGGLLVLFNRYVPLGLTILAPVIVNIVLFHATMAPSGLPLAALVTILWVIVFYAHRTAFEGIFRR